MKFHMPTWIGQAILFYLKGKSEDEVWVLERVGRERENIFKEVNDLLRPWRVLFFSNFWWLGEVYISPSPTPIVFGYIYQDFHEPLFSLECEYKISIESEKCVSTAGMTQSEIMIGVLDQFFRSGNNNSIETLFCSPWNLFECLNYHYLRSGPQYIDLLLTRYWGQSHSFSRQFEKIQFQASNLMNSYNPVTKI